MPGTYRIEVVNPGYNKLTRENIQLAAGTPVTLDLPLEAGTSGAPAAARVQGQPVLVQTENAEVAHTFDHKAINDLPIADRNHQELVNLQPGVTPPATAQSPLLDPQRSKDYAVNGASPLANNRHLDGPENNEPFLGDVSVHVPQPQSIQSFREVTSTWEPQRGRTLGAAEAVSTRTGTNGIHGDFFEHNGNNWFTARPFLAPNGTPFPRFTWNQFGGAVGGAMIRDKLFYYGSYQAQFLRDQIPTQATTPTVQFVPGSTSQLLAGAIPAFTPGSSTGLARVYNRNDGQIWDGRLDYRLDSNTSMFARYGYSRFFSAENSIVGNVGNPADARFRAHTGVIDAIHNFDPTLLGELRFSITRYSDNLYPTTFSSPLNNLFGFANLSPAVQSNLQSIGFPLVGVPGSFPFTGIDNTFQWTTNWSKVVGRHSLQFGADFWRIRSDGFPNAGLFGPLGGFVFGPNSNATWGSNIGYPAFANAVATGLLVGLPADTAFRVPTDTTTYRTMYYAGYIGDIWKLNSRITLDVGLRYDVFSPPEPRRKAGAFLYNPVNNLLLPVGVGGVNMRGNVRYDWDNFAPRFGVAFRVNDNTAVRAGYALSYFPNTLGFNGENFIFPFSGILAGVPAGFIPGGGLAIAPVPLPAISPLNGPVAAPNVPLTFRPPNPENPYVQTFHVKVQHAFGAGFVFDVGYVGALGRELPFSQDINAASPGAGALGQRLNLPFGRTAPTILLGNGLNSNYNSLQAILSKRFGHGLSLTGAYTFSKTLDQGSNPFVPLIRPSGSLNYGPADYDRQHMLTISHVWEIPTGKGHSFLSSGIASKVASGFAIDGIFTWATGTPFSVFALPAGCNCPGNPLLYANVTGPVGTPGGSTAPFNTGAFAQPAPGTFGNAGRNNVRGPDFRNYDFALVRSFTIKERGKLEFRGGAYNLTNSPKFANPVNLLNAGSFGQTVFAFPGNSLTPFGNRTVYVSGRITF
jgi:hypothetical protein